MFNSNCTAWYELHMHNSVVLPLDLSDNFTYSLHINNIETQEVQEIHNHDSNMQFHYDRHIHLFTTETPKGKIYGSACIIQYFIL